jgi:hypothetical protein
MYVVVVLAVYETTWREVVLTLTARITSVSVDTLVLCVLGTEMVVEVPMT